MSRTLRRDPGVLVLLLGILVTFSLLVSPAHAFTKTGGGTGNVPTDPQYGAGGGGSGGNGWSDPDELGIYSRPVPQTPPVLSPTTSSRAEGVGTETRPELGRKSLLYVWLFQFFGGLPR